MKLPMLTRLRPISTLLIISVILACIFAWTQIVAQPSSPDTWLHMNSGRFIFEHRKLPTHTDISYKDVDPEFRFLSHSWLSDVFIFLISQNYPEWGPSMLLITLLTLTTFLLFRVITLLKLSIESTLVSLIVALFLAPTFWKLHPLVFAIPLGMCIMYLHLSWMLNKDKIIYLLPVVCIVFAQVSGGYIFIPILYLAATVLYEIILRLMSFLLKKNVSRFQGNLLIYILLICCSLAVSLINPLGIVAWLYGPFSFSIVNPMLWFGNIVGILNIASQSYIKNSPSIILYGGYAIYLLTTLILLFALCIRNPKQTTPYLIPVLLLSLFFFLPFQSIRFIPFVTFATVPLFATLLQIVQKRYEHSRISRLVQYGICILIICSLTYVITHPIRTFTFDPPVNQIKFIKKHHLPPYVLTSQDITGYAAYMLSPQKSLIDVQDDLYDESQSIETYSMPQAILKKNFDDIVKRERINTILTNRDYASLASNISLHPDWALVYIDTNGYIFVKRNTVSESFLKHYELAHLDITRNLGFNPDYADEAARELERFTKENYSVLALGQLATIYRMSGKVNEAKSTIQKIPLNKWGVAEYTEMGRIKAMQGKCKEAEWYLLEAVEGKGEQNFSRAVLDLAVIYAGCLHDKTRAEHYFRRYDSFVLPESEHARVRKIADDFGITIIEN